MKKIFSKVLTGTMATMLILSAGLQVKANNHSDAYATAYLDEANGTAVWYTTGREKQDTTSGYVKNINSSYNGGTYFTLVGAGKENGTIPYDNFRLYRYSVKPGIAMYLTNLVKESGYNYAMMKVEPGTAYYYSTYFAWSPDSI